MRRTLVFLWFVASILLLLVAIALGYMSLMMGAVHWDWWLSIGLCAGFIAIAVACFWMCSRAYRLLKAS